MQLTKDFGNDHKVTGFRLSDGKGFIPMFTYSDIENIRQCEVEFKAAAEQYPYLNYWSEIEDNVSLICVTGGFFDRPEEEIWILAEDIKTLRDMPNRRHSVDKENFAAAIEIFLQLQLLADYASTENLRHQ